ncbi:MAG: aminopeptidase, partial [Candidatus Hodarchaeota archaeon]
MDPRIKEHARILVEWSTEVKPGELVVLSASPDSHELAIAVTKEVAKAGGSSIVLMESEEIARAIYDGASDETLQVFPSHLKALAEAADVYIGLKSPMNTRALATVDPKRQMIRAKTNKPLS